MFLISCQENKGLEEVENFLKDKITVIGGPSGVGKSSFINFLQSERILKTGEISERLQRGKHTTRDSNMIKIESRRLYNRHSWIFFNRNSKYRK